MKPWRELFFEEVEPPHHFHIGMRIIKTVIAVFVCAIIGWLRGEMTFFSMIAAVLCMQKSAEKTLSTSFNRVMGTAVGGAYGVIVLFLETQFNLQRVPPLFYLVVSLMLIPVILTTIGIKKPSVAGFACVVFLSTTVYHVGDADPYTYALNRMLDTVIGIVVALIVNLTMPGPYMLLRIPMESELEDVARWCDYSLESERATLDALEEACARQGAVHKAVIMADLGDLREGFWDQDEMLDVCVHVERDLPHVELAGVGVNLGCYGSIQPTPENLGQLVHIARRVEDAIGRKLEIVSGGATSSFTLVHWGTMPEGINHLRIGEGILVAKDLQVDWSIHDMDYLRMDCMTLRAQIVEVKDKPTHPVGPIMVDCFCNRPTYEDRGIRRRAIAGIGRADVGDIMMLHPRTPGMTVVGGSSDHCILDVEDCDPCPQVGDIVDFDVIYLTMLYASAREDVAVKFVD